jgi:peptidoglycan hydrolase CwlO-like protein
MRGKKDVERELIHAEAKIETLQALLDSAQADRVELKSQVTKLQDALVAAQAPEAYRDQQLAREEAERTPISDEQLERNRIMQETETGYMDAIERPLCADDLDALLARSAMRSIKAPASIHGNEES